MNTKNNVDRFNGFADTYDKYRPIPPETITELLINYRGQEPSLVADLGCGTGLSTFIWQDYASKIIGIDPNMDMLDKAKDKLKGNEDKNKVDFQLGYGNDTKLASNSVDIVTCGSAFQWMEPESTVNEVLRILVDGGVFAMYNHGHPSVGDWIVEKEYMNLFYKIYQILDDSREKDDREKLWTMGEYLDTMKKSNKFRFTKEILLHKKVKMNADDFIGFIYSQGALQEIMKKDITSINNEINKFCDVVRKKIDDRFIDAVFSYRLRVAIK